MNGFRSAPRRRSSASRKPDRVTPLLAVIAIIAVCALGWVSVDQFMPSGLPQQSTGQGASSESVTASFSICGSNRYTCVVDGDTVWYQGMNLRLQSYDTPEPYGGICGGEEEVALAKRASARLAPERDTSNGLKL